VAFFKRLASSLRSIRLPGLPLLQPIRRFIGDHADGIWTWGVRVGAVGSLVLIVLLIHRSIYSFISNQGAYTVRQSVAQVDVSPSWADRRTGDGVVTLKVDGAEWNLFDETLVARIGRSFEENAWVRRVTAVERVFPDQIRVKFDLRRPYVAIHRANGFYVVDRDGIRLPGVYTEPPACESSLRFTGLASTPPAAGQKWADAEIAAALEMAALIAQEPAFARAGVTGVDLANLNARLDRRRPELALLTQSGCVIEWGRVPSTTKFGELAVADKLDNLRQVLETYPNLETRGRVKLHVATKGQFPPTTPREADLGRNRK
jgi:hypothetical protein